MLTFLKDNRNWLGAGMVLTVLSSFGQTFFISIFAPVIQQDLGLSHSAWGLSYALGTMISAGIMVWAGGLTDTMRARSLGLWVMAGLVGACLLMAMNPYAILVPIVILCLRFFGQGMMSHVAVVAMARWFSKSRGRALSIAGLGYSVGEALLPILFVAAMGLVHWRWLWVLAALIVLLAMPFLRFLLRSERTPESIAQDDSSTGLDDRHWTRNEVIKTRLFWCLVPAILGPSAFITAYFFHHAHFAMTRDLTQMQIVATFPLYTAVGVVSMVITGAAIDRFGTGRLLPLFQIPYALGFLVFANASSQAHLAFGMILLGLSSGMNATIPSAFWAEYFGTKSLGSIKALATAIMVLGSALGPGITGVLIDTGVSLGTQYLWVTVYFIASSLLLVFGLVGLRARLPNVAA